MKKNNIELEKYVFVGDSSINEVICTKDDGSKVRCTQTALITALTENKEHIKGGSKLKLGNDNGKVSYEFLGNVDNSKQLLFLCHLSKSYNSKTK